MQREKVTTVHEELKEQARLNGMGAERELALMGKLATAEREVERLKSLQPAQMEQQMKLEWSPEISESVAYKEAIAMMTDGWGLPTRAEVITLCDSENFPSEMLDKWFWTCTPCGESIDKWVVSFPRGVSRSDMSMGDKNYVRLVRRVKPTNVPVEVKSERTKEEIIANLAETALKLLEVNAEEAKDAARYRWLARYMVSNDLEHDDAIVGCVSVKTLSGFIDAAREGTL